MYPNIAKLLDITVDELMGNEVKKETTDIKKLKVTVISSILSLIIIILLVALIIINPFKIVEKNKLINESEEYLEIKLPKIEEYNIVNYNEWLSFNNDMYPLTLSYFVFKDEVIKIDETWMDKMPQKMIDKIPVGSSEYPYICDYYKLVNENTKEINKISSGSEKNEYILYCLQIQNKRLIIIEFEV